MTVRLALMLMLMLATACADKGNGTESKNPTRPAGGAGGGEGSGGEKPQVKLAESPTVDLVANRYRFHTGSATSLTVPLAAEGVRKYSQDYARPWGGVVEVGGTRGRVLSRRSTELRVPWRGDAPETLRFHVHGLSSGQRLSVSINGKSAGSKTVEDEWQTLEFPAGAIEDGENEVQIILKRAGRTRAGKSYALWHSLTVGKDGEGAVALEPVAELSGRQALTGHGRFSIYTEIPKTAHLVVDTGATADATLSIRATPLGKEPVTLLSEKQSSGWESRRMSLAALAGQLVVLDFETTAPAASGWAGARIALEDAPVAERPAPLDNAVLVVVDALRADKLAAYDPDTRVETPRMSAHIDELGAVFLHMQAASPSSPPSHGSIQTGMIPRVHGVVGDNAKLGSGTPMLSTQARDAGLAAGYYGNNSFGMGRLEKPGNWTEFHQPGREGKGNDCSALIPEMLGFAKRQKEAGKRFVLSSLPYEPHTNYRYHEGITDKYHDGPWGPPVGKSVGGGLITTLSSGRTKLTKEQWEQYFALYDGEVTYFDGCYGNLLDGLKELGLSDNTAVILTSDHGEGMYEHGRGGHAFGHYAELGNIPLVVFAPGLTDGGKRIDVPTSHIDIVPTILDLLGVDIDERVQGRSLVPLILRKGPWTPRVVSLEYGRSYSLRARQWRYIVDYSGNESLYSLADDPTEQNDVVKSSPVSLRYMRDTAGFFLAHRSEWTVPKWGDLVNHSPKFAEDMAR